MKAPEHRLCVYCGSGPGKTPAYMAAAGALGITMVEAGIGLVYGGGNIGLMGEVARTVLANGGHVTGIIPEFLVARERMLEGVNELIVTQNMHERKMAMFQHSTGFVALPGGIGTLEELTEISTWAQLDQHQKPIIICNVEGFWNPYLALIDHMRNEQFIREGLDVRTEVVDSAQEVVPAYQFRKATTRENVPLAALRGKL